MGGAAFLLLAALVAAPEIATAKVRPSDSGPTTDGDPTADDQPSPTPKNRSARFGGGGTLQIRESAVPTRWTSNRMTWDLYLRILSRLTLR
jgi:hypothetical protein